MHLSLPLASGRELERLLTATYQFAETRTFCRPSVQAETAPGGVIAHLTFALEDDAAAFRRFWSTARGRGASRAA